MFPPVSYTALATISALTRFYAKATPAECDELEAKVDAEGITVRRYLGRLLARAGRFEDIEQFIPSWEGSNPV